MRDDRSRPHEEPLPEDDEHDLDGDALLNDPAFVESVWVSAGSAPNAVVAGMAEQLLIDAGYEVEIVSDDFIGIGGHAARPQIHCHEADLLEVRRLLEEHGFV